MTPSDIAGASELLAKLEDKPYDAALQRALKAELRVAVLEAECKRLGNANLDALTIAQALEELRRAVDRFFGYTMTGNQTHIRVPWKAWDDLSVAFKNLPAWLFCEPPVDASRFDLLSKAKAAALHLGEALRYCASIAGQEGAGRAASSPYKAIETAARCALETVR